MKTSIEKGRSKRGVALITVILMVVVLLILSGALLSSTISEMQGIGANGISNQALNAAYAGLDDMVLKLEENTSGTNIGVQQPFTVQHHAHMAFPEHQVAALRCGTDPPGVTQGDEIH